MASLVFDTVAHRDTAQGVVVTRGGTASAFITPDGRPGLQADMNVALDDVKARNIRDGIRLAKTSGWIVGGDFHIHRCTHDEGPDNWRDCKTLSYEVN